MNLYWLYTNGHHESWFVVSESAKKPVDFSKTKKAFHMTMPVHFTISQPYYDIEFVILILERKITAKVFWGETRGPLAENRATGGLNDCVKVAPISC